MWLCRPRRTLGRRGARAFVAALSIMVAGARAQATVVVRPRSRSPLLDTAIDRGRANPTDRHHVVVGLALHDRESLDAFLVDVHDPASPRYHRFLTQAEFNALYAPTKAEERAVRAHLEANGLRVTDRFPNRLVIGAVGTVTPLERAFGVEIHAVERNGRMHYAAIAEP